MKAITLCFALGFLLAACGARADQKESTNPKSIEFALSTPGHVEDWERLRQKLTESGIHCIEYPSDLGTMHLGIAAEEFVAAKRAAVDFTTSSHLTLRLRGHPATETYEVWADGKKIKEESYIIEKK